MNFESRNPATGELLGVYREHDKAETEVRLQRAWNGWRHWSRTPLQERIAFLTRLAQLLEERADTYSRLITAEMGKPLADSIFEIKKSAWAARHLAQAGQAYLKPQPIPGVPAQIIYESVGPIFSVQPWNVPFWQVLRFFNTTAIVGNTAIIKHAESVQGCAEALETLVRDAGGPEGLYVNLAIRVEACAAVIADPRVRAAWAVGGFSDSLAMEVAPFGVKICTLEPGGMRTNWARRAGENMPDLLPDYEASVGSIHKMFRELEGRWESDPRKIAGVILQLANSDEVPVRLILGVDAEKRVRQAEAARAREAEKWRYLTVSTVFEDGRFDSRW